jgi:3-oxoacyl-[acyl-carrier protein] reductase
MFEQIDAYHGHPPDILISNAGYGNRITQIWDIGLEEFDTMMNINLRASFILVKGVVEHMKSERWGRIVFMSSIAAYGGGINECRVYARFLILAVDEPSFCQTTRRPRPD